MKRRMSEEAIGAQLRTGHFGASAQDLPIPDPISESHIYLDLTEIEIYEDNPRREKNEKYDEIKASIKANGGLTHPFTVTRRPGAARYVIASGGNTRYQILTELYDETGDLRFKKFFCIFKPWPSKGEERVLVDHLIENKLRGDLTFLDEANAVKKLRTLLESEEQKPIGDREFVRRAVAQGYSLSRRHYHRMQFVTDILYPSIPVAAKKLGAKEVDRISTVISVYKKLWEDSKKNPEIIDQLIANVLADSDGDSWEIEVVRRNLDVAVARQLDVEPKAIRLGTDALLFSAPEDEDFARSEDRSADELQKTHDGSESVTDHVPSSGVGNEGLRSQNYQIARGLARRHGFQQCVKEVAGRRRGFDVSFPDKKIDPESPAQWVWWLLFMCSAKAPNDADRPRNHPKPDWQQLMSQFFTAPEVEERDIRDIFRLIGNCRRLQ